jgi:dolichol-phosphate mannosyltransferase
VKNEIQVSVIAPMFNEASGIQRNVRMLLSCLKQLHLSWELILVNDGSTDDSLSLVNEVAGSEPRVKIISYQANRGRGYALRRGFQEAKGSYIITTESDLSWGAGIIEQLYDALSTTGADVVIASPYKKGGRLENIPFKRAVLSRFGNKLLTFAVPGRLTMISGMTRGYRREVIDSLVLESDRKEIHLEIAAKCLALGYRVIEIPAVLKWEKQPGGQQRKSSFHSRKLIFSHLAFSFYQKPMLVFGVSGFVMLVAGIILGVMFIIQRYMGTLNPTRPLYILMILLLLGGIHMLSFGFIANQIGILKKEMFRIQRELKYRNAKSSK